MAAKPTVEPHFVFGGCILVTNDHRYVQLDGSLGDIVTAKVFDEPGQAEEYAKGMGYPLTPISST